MRLVSKAMNEFIEPRAFASTTIDFTRLRTGRQLECLAQGTGPNARWTKRLKIDFLFRVASDSSPDIGRRGQWDLASQQEQAAQLREYQNKFLIPAIKTLANVKSVRILFQTFRPNDEVIRAIFQLHKLQELTLVFEPEWESLEPFPDISPLGNLTSLALEGIPSLSLTSIVLVSGLISRSPMLESLTLQEANRDRGTDDLVDLADLFAGALASPAFVPRLRKLALRGRTRRFITLSPACVPYLSALKNLAIDENQAIGGESVDESTFWSALSSVGLKVVSLRIYPVTPAVAAYLESYPGLETLNVSGNIWGRDEDKISVAGEHAMASLVFHTVLPRHKETLRAFHICDIRWSQAWTLGRYLDSIVQCDELRMLRLPFHYTSDRRSPDITAYTLISQVSARLKHLQKLYISLAKYPIDTHPIDRAPTSMELYGVCEDYGVCDTDEDEVYEHASAFEEEVCKIKIHQASFEIYVDGAGDGKLIHNPNAGRFVRVACDYDFDGY
ncbi:hypothetical protein DFP72DRAFT_1063518 [Ephemerocybe angulata]|uniref:Uncharacterized protein n=1 Tax=Ephemerocybe angulata TaxID=980116 RepID=A0A8H6I9J3_9AGAR|nr:hypothetical protein DFP72DRAFT_1063518 [Tulosesus angulatus]